MPSPNPKNWTAAAIDAVAGMPAGAGVLFDDFTFDTPLNYTFTAHSLLDEYASNSRSFQSLSAGGEGGRGHTCGVRPDGGVECWGSNYWGEGDVPTP